MDRRERIARKLQGAAPYLPTYDQSEVVAWSYRSADEILALIEEPEEPELSVRDQIAEALAESGGRDVMSGDYEDADVALGTIIRSGAIERLEGRRSSSAACCPRCHEIECDPECVVAAVLGVSPRFVEEHTK